MSKVPKSTNTKLIRLLLRSIPFIPGPEIYDLFDDIKDSRKTINQKIDRAYASLKETSELVDELHSELEERTSKVKELKVKYEHFSKLAEVEEEKAKPLIDEIQKSLGKNKNKEVVIAFLINIIAGILIFLLGIWLGPKITDWIDKKDETDNIENVSIENNSRANWHSNGELTVPNIV